MEENTTSAKNLVGIEVKHSEMVAVFIEKNGKLIDSHKSHLNLGEDTAPQLIDFIRQTEQKFGEFEKIGIAIPGLYNRLTKKVVYSTHIPEHAEIDLVSELESATKLKIYVENDANAAAYGEYILGAGRGSRNIFYVTLGRGIGGALIFDHKLWHGVSGFAGEFGHIAINSEGMKLEDVASSANIIRRTKNWFHQDPTSSLNSIGEDNITIADVVKAATTGDDFAQLILERTGTYVGTAIAGVINLLNIEKVIVGGEIMKAESLVLNAIKQRARELTFAPSFATVEINAGQLGENASAIGVALISDLEL